MRQSRSASAAQVRELKGLGDLAYRNAAEPRVAVLSRKGAGGEWEDVTSAEFVSDVASAAKGLIAAGVGVGDRVVVVCGTRYEWVLIAFAVWMVRAVVVPVPPACSAERLQHIVRDCRPAAIVLEDGGHAATVGAMQHELTDLARIWRLDEGGMEAICRPGAYMDSTAVRFRREEARREDPAAIVYPVSTVVRTRGAVLTHGNYLAAAEGVCERLAPALQRWEKGKAATLMYLPLGESYGHAALVACMMAQVRVGLLPPGGVVLRELREFRPTVLVALPRLLEAVHAREKRRARDTSWDNLNSYNAATDLAVEFDKAERKGAWRRMSRAMYEWMYARIREALGGRVEVIVCAGGLLSERMDRFYSGVGMPVFQMFGTVETGGAVTANAPGERRAGSCGRPLPGAEVRLSRDGEVHVRGPGVFPGYWNDPGATQAAFRDGWLATGYAGAMDGEGYLQVERRLRPQASLAAALAAPQPRPWVYRPPDVVASVAEGAAGVDHAEAIERRLLSHPLVSQVMVISEGRPYASALITLVSDQVEYWRLVNNRPLAMSREELAADPDLLGEIQAAVQEANAAVPAEWAVRAFHVLADELTVQSGLVLASGELRRDVILRAFSEEIDGLYRDFEAGQRD